MKKQISIYDVLGTVEGLQKYGDSLRDAAQGKVHDIGDYGTGVLVDPVAIITIAQWMLDAGVELRNLIPDGPLAAFDDIRRTRTLVRVVGQDSGDFLAVLPGWNPDVEVRLGHLPEKLKHILLSEDPSEDEPHLLWAWVNLGASSPEQLQFSDWELP